MLQGDVVTNVETKTLSPLSNGVILNNFNSSKMGLWFYPK